MKELLLTEKNSIQWRFILLFTSVNVLMAWISLLHFPDGVFKYPLDKVMHGLIPGFQSFAIFFLLAIFLKRFSRVTILNAILIGCVLAAEEGAYTFISHLSKSHLNYIVPNYTRLFIHKFVFYAGLVYCTEVIGRKFSNKLMVLCTAYVGLYTLLDILDVPIYKKINAADIVSEIYHVLILFMFVYIIAPLLNIRIFNAYANDKSVNCRIAKTLIIDQLKEGKSKGESFVSAKNQLNERMEDKALVKLFTEISDPEKWDNSRWINFTIVVILTVSLTQTYLLMPGNLGSHYPDDETFFPRNRNELGVLFFGSVSAFMLVWKAYLIAGIARNKPSSYKVLATIVLFTSPFAIWLGIQRGETFSLVSGCFSIGMAVALLHFCNYLFPNHNLIGLETTSRNTYKL